MGRISVHLNSEITRDHLCSAHHIFSLIVPSKVSGKTLMLTLCTNKYFNVTKTNSFQFMLSRTACDMSGKKPGLPS